jgi:hypothetical protein
MAKRSNGRPNRNSRRKEKDRLEAELTRLREAHEETLQELRRGRFMSRLRIVLVGANIALRLVVAHLHSHDELAMRGPEVGTVSVT